MEKNKIIVFIVLVVLAVFIFIFGLASGYSIKDLGKEASSECSSSYEFINKILNCEYNRVIKKTNLTELRQKTFLYIETNKQQGNVNEVSVYLRDLHEGPTMSINDDQNYFSASLLKLPIALTYFRLKEEDPSLEHRIIDFKLTEDYQSFDQNYKPKKSIKTGEKYTIEDLTEYSLKYSDNLANDVLKITFDKIEEEEDSVSVTLKELGLIMPNEVTVPDISTKAYASIFRILYNGAYLNLDDSETILKYLSESDFDKGLKSGIPKEVKVAHKFGERFLDDEKQLHDCGIVYFPGNPYLICIMSRGKDFKDLEKTISDISKMVYDEFESRRIN